MLLSVSLIIISVLQTPADTLLEQLNDIIQDLYQLMVQTTTYDTTPRPSKDVLTSEIKHLSRHLQSLHSTASPLPSGVDKLPSLPPELVEYVENGRNPDIYTREFVEGTRRSNQLMRGKMMAFGRFRDELARDMCSAMPELRADVEKVLENTGGSVEALEKKEEAKREDSQQAGASNPPV